MFSVWTGWNTFSSRWTISRFSAQLLATSRQNGVIMWTA